MANKSIAMNKLKCIFRLYTEGKSKAFISSYVDLSRNTVKKYLKTFHELQLTYQDLNKMSDGELNKLFLAPKKQAPCGRLKKLQEFFPYMSRELRKTGVTKQLLWEEYIQKHPDGYMSSQFCEHYNRWSKRSNPVMHIPHKAGDKMYVDYTGKKLELIDKTNGEIQQVEVFVSILGSSQLIYVEATLTQQKDDFINSVQNAMHYYQGVPAAIVPDNLKSAVTKSSKYEPKLNDSFADMAEHYQTTVLPARAYRPRDKSLVEGAVKIIYTRIYAGLRNQQFYSLGELNKAIFKLLELLNNQNLKGRSYSRRSLFEQIERSTLKPLPLEPYQIKEQAYATVMQNGHVCLQKDKHNYSVPYKYIRKKVKLVYSSKQVEIFYKYERIACHKRTKSPFNYTTVEDHLASKHQFMTKWNPDFFIKWAGGIHKDVETLICKILEKKQHPEQAYRSCVGILGLSKKVGNERLIKACGRALDYEIHNYMIVHKILEKGLDKLDETPIEDKLPKHQNIRGKDYYK